MILVLCVENTHFLKEHSYCRFLVSITIRSILSGAADVQIVHLTRKLQPPCNVSEADYLQ